MIHVIQTEQLLKTSLDEAWDFFSHPKNLEQITPSDVGFKITHNLSDEMHVGQIIQYKIKLMPCIALTWVTEISYVENRRGFIDDQRIGPYKMWHHLHEFEETPDGVLMRDTVHYAIPFGLFGWIAKKLFVEKKLQSIFRYRAEVIEEIFSSTSA